MFVGKPDPKQYGVEGRTCRVVASVRAYPEPTAVWSRGGTVLMAGEKYNMSLSARGALFPNNLLFLPSFLILFSIAFRSGELCLEIFDFSSSDVGMYEVRLSNEFGSTSLSVDVDLADPPTFLEPLRDQVFHLRQNGVLECRVHGIPYPTGSNSAGNWFRKVCFEHLLPCCVLFQFSSSTTGGWWPTHTA